MPGLDVTGGDEAEEGVSLKMDAVGLATGEDRRDARLADPGRAGEDQDRFAAVAGDLSPREPSRG
jgi:hypothetical protein